MPKFKSQKVLIIASSSSNTKFVGAKKVVQQFQTKGQPLNGIAQDIETIKQLNQSPWAEITILKTSKHQNCLRSKRDILNRIELLFSQHFQDCQMTLQPFRIYYTGHGHKNGDWAPQTVQNNQADRISLEQIMTLWKNKKDHNEKHRHSLSIVMDSCFSGAWIQRFIQKHEEENWHSVDIQTSRSSTQYSYTGPKGGYFLSLLKNPQLKECYKNYQTPQMLSIGCTKSISKWQLKELIHEYMNF